MARPQGGTGDTSDGSRRAMLVEFAGLPGAGKSTLARGVTRILRQAGIPVEEALGGFAAKSRGVALLRKAAYVGREGLRRPRHAYRSALAICATEQRSVADAVRVFHNWLLVSSLMEERANAAGIRLFDQGVFQAVWSIGYSARAGALAQVVERLRPLLPRPDLVVLVEASTLTVKRRLTARPYGRSRLELSLDDQDLFLRAAMLLEELKSTLARMSTPTRPMAVMVIDNGREGAFEENAITVAAHIRRLYRTGQPDPARTGRSEYAGARG